MMLRTVALATIAAALIVSACGGGGSSSGSSVSYRLTPIEVPPGLLTDAVGLLVIPGSDDEAVVWSQDGTIRRVSLVANDLVPTLIGDISDRTKGLGQNRPVEHGLLGLAFSPDFQLDGDVYLYYTGKDTPGGTGRTILSRFTVGPDGFIDESSERILLEVSQPTSAHNGGQLAFGPDNHLYLALGDGGGPRGELNTNGQDLSTLLGTILRLDVSGGSLSIPPDNPFVDVATARPEIYAYGLRNPWRFSFDRLTGDLWAGDKGWDVWEEIDLIVAGGNYGWMLAEGPDCIMLVDDTYQQIACDSETVSFRPPDFAYPRGACAAVIGGYVYRGRSMPELNGWYVYGDFCNGDGIWAFDTAGAAAMRLTAFDEPVTSFAERPDGELLVLTTGGEIFQLGP